MKINRLIYIFGTFLFVLACSTEKNTFVTRTYHNITAKYNAYFNGKESFKAGLQKVDDSFEDDYTHILPIFKYGDENIAQSVAPEMERAIDKATKVIEKHSITAKPKNLKKKKSERKKLTDKEKEYYSKTEYNKWVDDSYLMMGKAYFYEHEFMMAIKTFRYILREFKTDEVKYKALIWLVRIENERGEFKEANEILNKITEEYKELIDVHYYTTYADFHLKQQQYNESIHYLEEALEKEKKRDKRIRYTFILAQLYQETGDLMLATENYEKVIRKNPPYKMAFNAKINKATCYRKGSGNIEEVKKQLFKMLKDDKNIEYQDQIYYALGSIEERAGNMEQALEYYEKSAQASVSNDIQKTTSYLTIADIYYQRKEYKKAGAYYDSSSMYITENYPDYKRIMEKTELLIDLVDNLNTVEREDNLQRLAQMSEKERLAVIDRNIAEYKEKERQRQIEESNRALSQYYYRNRLNQNAGQSRGQWYFYDPSTIKRGKQEFQAKWGERKLEDNWRRSDKSIEMGSEFEDEIAEDDEAQEDKKELSKTSREYYLREIPLNDSLMELSHERIKESLFRTARIYQEDLKDYEKAAKQYNELVTRYPESEFTLLSYYQLYQLYNELNKPSQANQYKQLILNKFPESIHAKVLENPDYLKNIELLQSEADKIYEQAYIAYKNKQYSKVNELADLATKKYSDRKELVRKFEYLKLLSFGHTNPPKMFQEKLNAYIEKYPDTEQSEQAKDILAHIMEKYPDVKEEKEKETAKAIYTTNYNMPHYFILVIGSEADINQLMFNLINFNVEYFKAKELNVNGENLGDENQIAVVKQFKNKTPAMEYYQTVIEQQEEVLTDITSKTVKYFVIDENNYKILMQDQSVSTYMHFFETNYTE